MAASEADWIDAAEAADRLGVKPATLYSYVSRGVLHRRRHRDGRRSLFDAAEVAALRRRSQPHPSDSDQLTFVSSITSLGDDRPYYRGRDAVALARTDDYEQVAEWLWTGALPDATPAWASLPDAVDAAVAAQAALPHNTLPLDRLQVITTTLAVADPMRFNLDASAVVATGRAIVAGMVDALPQASRRKPTSGGRIVDRLWPKLTAAPPEPALVRVLHAALVVLADHELAASTVAARVAASVKADPYAVVTAALGVVGGPMHGGASLGAERMLSEIGGPDDAPRVIGARLRRGERIPGVGHSVYTSGDARGDMLLELLHEAAPGHRRLAAADALLAELRSRQQLPKPNVDFAIAALSVVSGMRAGSGEAIFAIARTAGWVAHALEEYKRRSPLRPRAVYVGPPPASNDRA